ncbi:MAG: PD-(D/E)XK nuclease family protein [Candidatus Electryonea clarkiae]|nr:PD-(D/E)XK nuclease family protein [Candidatus Electryonea clarkiae]MDP8287035.1 PD-(D/E)XK nuclease family protein [Candidatus Electryonea clarkiae]
MQLSPLHQSTIKSYLWCGRSFKYQYIDCIPQAFRNLAAVHGTVIHKIIHLMHTVEWEQDVNSVYPFQFDLEEQTGRESHIPIFFKGDKDKELLRLTAEAVEIIDGYKSKAYILDAEVILSEAQFTVKMGRAGVFAGTIDQLRLHSDDSYELVDLKTSQFKPDKAFLDCDYQFSIYSYALWKGVFKMPDGSLCMLDIPPERLSIIWLHMRNYMKYKRVSNGNKPGDEKGDARFTTSRTRKQLAEAKRDVSAIASCIRRGISQRNPDQQRCGWCRYSSVCIEDSKDSVLNRRQLKEVEQLMEA